MLLAMAIIVVEVVPLVLQRIARLIFDFPPGSTTSHELVDMLFRHAKVRHPTAMLDVVLAHFPVRDAMHAHIGARCIERHIMHETTLMHDTRAAVAALIMGDASLLLRHVHLREQRRMIALFDAEDRVTRLIV